MLKEEIEAHAVNTFKRERYLQFLDEMRLSGEHPYGFLHEFENNLSDDWLSLRDSTTDLPKLLQQYRNRVMSDFSRIQPGREWSPIRLNDFVVQLKNSRGGRPRDPEVAVRYQHIIDLHMKGKSRKEIRDELWNKEPDRYRYNNADQDISRAFRRARITKPNTPFKALPLTSSLENLSTD